MTTVTPNLVGVNASRWFLHLNKRVRFILIANGRRELYSGVVRWVSPTQALIKVACEIENDRGVATTKVIEFPTDAIDELSVRELRKGEQA